MATNIKLTHLDNPITEFTIEMITIDCKTINQWIQRFCFIRERMELEEIPDFPKKLTVEFSDKVMKDPVVKTEVPTGNRWGNLLGTYENATKKITLYYNAIAKTTRDPEYPLIDAFEEVFIHELFHAYHYAYCAHNGKPNAIDGTDDDTTLVVESLASFFELEYCESFGIKADIRASWDIPYNQFPYAGAAYIHTVDRFGKILEKTLTGISEAEKALDLSENNKDSATSIDFNQDNINVLSDYILDDKELKQLATKDDWKELFKQLYMRKAGDSIIALLCGSFGFLYAFFKAVDNVDLLKMIRTTIPSRAFAGFVSDASDKKVLKEIDVPNNISTIGASAFAGCLCLEKITLPVTLTKIEPMAFCRCCNLRGIEYKGTEAEWNEIEKGKYWDLGTKISITYLAKG